MTESSSPTEKQNSRDWGGWAAVIASLIGLLALCVSGYTAWLQRQQVRAQVWPLLETGISPSSRNMLLMNKGVGPARVGGLQLFVDRKPQHDWRSAMRSLGLQDMTMPPYSTANGIVVSSGERLQQLAFLDAKDFARFEKQYRRIDLKICYCSALDECWVLDERIAEKDQQRTEVVQCPAKGPDEFIDN
jgi:hypothetical protein